MRGFRRYASLVALLVFLTSGPAGAWHVATEAAPAEPCHAVAVGTAVGDAHCDNLVPDGTGCLACHLFQQVRGPVSVGATLVKSPTRRVRLLSPDLVPFGTALVDLLPARAPPPTQP